MRGKSTRKGGELRRTFFLSLQEQIYIAQSKMRNFHACMALRALCIRLYACLASSRHVETPLASRPRSHLVSSVGDLCRMQRRGTDGRCPVNYRCHQSPPNWTTSRFGVALLPICCHLPSKAGRRQHNVGTVSPLPPRGLHLQYTCTHGSVWFGSDSARHKPI